MAEDPFADPPVQTAATQLAKLGVTNVYQKVSRGAGGVHVAGQPGWRPKPPTW